MRTITSVCARAGVVFLVLFAGARAQQSPAVVDSGAPSPAVVVGEDSGASPATEQPTIIAQDENLLILEEDDLLISDDSEETILDESNPASADAETVGDDEAPAQLPDSAVAEASPDSDPDSRQVAEEERTAPAADADTRQVVAPEFDESTETESTQETAVEPQPEVALVEETRSINFARGLKEYRSPKKAMFMSLLVPGLGQAYAGGYWKTAVFAVAEAAIIGASVHYSFKGKQEKQKARKLADTAYSAERFADFYGELRTYLREGATSVNEKIDGSDSTLNDIFFGFDGEALKSNAEKKSEEFYKTIEHMFYVQGWEDCEPSFSADNSGYQVGSDGFIHGEHYVYKYFRDDTTWFLDAYDSVGAEAPVEGQSKIFGYSEYHQQYLDILGQSNAYYRVSTQLIFALVANHVVSAVDAFITARGHNDRLLGKQSVWQKVGLDQHLAYNPSEGIQTSIGLRYRF